MNRYKVFGILALGLGLVIGLYSGGLYFFVYPELTKIMFFKSHILLNLLWPTLMGLGTLMFEWSKGEIK